MKLEIEIWKPVVGYENLYEVSNIGGVRSVRDGVIKILTPRVNEKGYLRINLCKNGKMKSYYVHRLVAEAFIPNPHNLPCINHIDENPLNPVSSNLEWCTYKYNNNYGKHLEKISKPVLCVELNVVFQSGYEAGRQTGIPQPNINKCLNGERMTAGGYHWEYVNDSTF